MRFFKAVEVKKDYERQLIDLLTDWIIEKNAVHPDQGVLNLIVAEFTQLGFELEELGRATRCTPLMLREGG